jgi:hypothetical protein
LHIHPRSHLRINWTQLTDLAGFSEWDRKVLLYRLNETSRDCALVEQTDEKSRRALQAAWRKFDRNGVKRLQKTLEKYFPECVPESGFSDTR